MSKFNLKNLLYSFTIFMLSCNQEKTEITNQKVAEKKTSYFKDSTSFTEGTKVFVKPIAQMLVIDSVKNVDDKVQYFISGKVYQAKDLHSLEIKEKYHN